MNVTVIKPNVTEYRIRTEPGDAIHTRCMWANILLNHDTYTISAQTDCGDYSYRWPATKDESFRDLLLRALRDEEYLLSKFSERSRFSLEETKQLFLESNGLLDPECPGDPIVQAVREIDANTEAEWIEQMNDLHYDDAPWDYIVREYPAQAYTFVRLLTSVILPMIKEEKRGT